MCSVWYSTVQKAQSSRLSVSVLSKQQCFYDCRWLTNKCLDLLYIAPQTQSQVSNGFQLISSSDPAQGTSDYPAGSAAPELGTKNSIVPTEQTHPYEDATPPRAHRSHQCCSFPNSGSLPVADGREELEAVVTEQCSSSQKSSPTRACARNPHLHMKCEAQRLQLGQPNHWAV